MINIALVLCFFYAVGWLIHKLLGKDGGRLHYIFIGAAGTGLAALLEEASGLYTQTLLGSIALALGCSLAVEILVRRIGQRLWMREMEDEESSKIE